MLQQLIPVSAHDLLSHRLAPGAACHDGALTEPLERRRKDDSDSPGEALTNLREELALHHERLRAFMVSPWFSNPAYASSWRWSPARRTPAVAFGLPAAPAVAMVVAVALELAAPLTAATPAASSQEASTSSRPCAHRAGIRLASLPAGTDRTCIDGGCVSRSCRSAHASVERLLDLMVTTSCRSQPVNWRTWSLDGVPIGLVVPVPPSGVW